MGMTKNQVMTAVIITIIDQTFSLHAIDPLIFGLNVKFLMIFIDVVIGFMFISVLLVSLYLKKHLREEIIIYLILGVTGLAVYPLLAFIRFLALFKLVQNNKVASPKVQKN